MTDTELTEAQIDGGFDAWVKEDRIPPIQRKHHLKTWMRAQAALLAAAPAPTPQPVAQYGMHAAADYIDAKADKYLQDCAHVEGDTGATAFHYGEAGREYHSSLVELAEELRAQSAPVAAGKSSVTFQKDTF